MGFQLTVLGSAGTHTGPGRACSGYLYHTPDTRVLVDCGNGASTHLLTRCGWEDLDAVVISHRHVDHCIDLIGAFYALRFHQDGHKVVPLYAPAEVVDVLKSLLTKDSAFLFTEVFQYTEIAPGDTFEVGDLRFECFHSVHPAPTVSLRTTGRGRVLTYSSDSAGSEDLITAAQGSDLFLCEATWQGDADRWPAGIHLTARDAGRYGDKADAPRMLLTHILGTSERAVSLEQAAETYTGRLELAEDGLTYQV